ncbi:uncharacterized protein LOC112873521 isoform X3 [Panicum hallii]|uniref:uncharacterized protein LOC112873521 isoform X3 n=1 Tax=Panicum hallii TaxID=206008 RepID=UPI000DF4E245|nr:uncharacterized protein LOC112873521 isoform X3 [Panicum hallii]
MKDVVRIAKLDNPKDLKDVLEKALKLFLKMRMDKGPADQPSDVPVIIDDGKLPGETTPGINALHFKDVNMVKLFKAFLAAGVICGVHHLDVVARHRMAKESGVALFLAISASAAVPIAPFVVTKTGGMVPSDVAKAAALLAGFVCPGLLGHPIHVTNMLPHAMSGANSSAPRFGPAGFVSVVVVPFLSCQTTLVIGALDFKDVNMVKLFKSFFAARVICGVHHLDVVACHRMAKESGVALFLAISAPAAVPTAPFVVTKTSGKVPSEVAKAAALLAVLVCPGLFGHPIHVTNMLPHAMSGANSSAPRFGPAGFVSVVLAPFLSSQTTPAIDALHFKDVNMVKLFKSFLAAGVICGVHHLHAGARGHDLCGSRARSAGGGENSSLRPGL